MWIQKCSFCKICVYRCHIGLLFLQCFHSVLIHRIKDNKISMKNTIIYRMKSRLITLLLLLITVSSVTFAQEAKKEIPLKYGQLFLVSGVIPMTEGIGKKLTPPHPAFPPSWCGSPVWARCRPIHTPFAARPSPCSALSFRILFFPVILLA